MRWWYAFEEASGKGSNRNAGSKARQDINLILDDMGVTRINVFDTLVEGDSSMLARLKKHRAVAGHWLKSLQALGPGDGLILQVPCINHTIYIGKVVNDLKKHGVKIVIIIHDLDSLRGMLRSDVSMVHKRRIAIEEKPLLEGADAAISHNAFMTKALVDSYGIDRNKIVDLEIFDYLCPGSASSRDSSPHQGSVAVAGNLSPHKAGYLYSLPSSVSFSLYGVGLDQDRISYLQNVSYKGSFPPDELPNILGESFGLVWDGPSATTCEGAFGAYLRINNPHKTSLYLSAGTPVITWNEAAMARFLSDERVGIAVSSLEQIHKELVTMTPDRYAELYSNAQAISKRLRGGHYTRTAVTKACQIASGN